MERMVNEMKSYKVTQKQIDIIRGALQRYLDYVNDFCMEYAAYFKDMDATNEIYKKNPEYFFNENRIDRDKFFEDWKNYQLLPIAEKVLKEIENIHTNIIAIFIEPQDEIVYPAKAQHWIYTFRDFCFDDEGNFLSVEKQNEKLAKHYHFDASTKKPKTFRTQ